MSLTETSPLLQGLGPASATTTDNHGAARSKKSTIIWVLLLVDLLSSSAGGFLAIPTTRLIEDVLCRQYYGEAQNFDVPIDERLCKEPAIQSRLSFIIATQSSLIAAVALLAAFPWSLAADRIGRKPVLMCCVTGMTIGSAVTVLVLWFRDVFPVELIWLEAAAQLIGGGNPVALGLLLSIVADATTEEERAVMFMRQTVATSLGNLLAPTLSSFIMERAGPWPPSFIGLALLSLSVVALAFIPETMPAKPACSTTEEEGEHEDGHPSERRAWRLSHLAGRLRESLSILRSPSLVILLVACLGMSPINRSTSLFMPVFLSKRYGIQLFQAGYVQSAFGVAQAAQSLLVLPWLSRLLLRPTTPRPLRFPGERHRDLAVARWSACATGLAALLLGLAPTLSAFALGLAVLATGAGCVSLLRSLMSHYVDPVHRSRVFGLVGMVDIVGTIYAQPMLAGLFSLGMRFGGGWMGLPYFVLAVLVAGMVMLLMLVRVPKEVGTLLSSSSEEEEEEF